MGSEDISDFWFTHGGFSPVVSYEAPDTSLRSWGAMIGYLQPTCADPQYSWHPELGACVGLLSADHLTGASWLSQSSKRILPRMALSPGTSVRSPTAMP